jgi:hypothetical protein
MLAGVALEKEDNINHTLVGEDVFSTLISPSRGTVLSLVRPITLEREAGRKWLFILVYRRPEKPREALVAPTTPLNRMAREISPVTVTPPAPAQIPASTAPVRLDGRERRTGKNSRYDEGMAITWTRTRRARRAWWAWTRRQDIAEDSLIHQAVI